jgi:predicted permease
MWWRRFFARRADAEADLDAELRFHLEEEVRLRVERGEDPDAARAAARRLFGNVATVQETTRDMWAWAQPVMLWRSASLIIRSFTRAKGFTIAALLVVALGIGVNAVVFSLFDRVLFRPLPYHEPDRLVQIQSQLSPTGVGEPVMRSAVTLALARETDTFTGIGWASGGDPDPLVPVPGENPLLWLTRATTNTLDVLGIRPVIGAGMSAFPASTSERPVMLTYEVWQHRYGASSDVLSLAWTTRDAGQNDVHWRVVGVLPQGFLLPTANLTTAPFDGIYGIDPRFDRQLSLDWVGVAPFARLAPGVSRAAAQARVNVLVMSQFPRLRTPSGFQPTTVRVLPLQTGLSTLSRSYAWLAVVGAWIVLGVTCLTLAILLLTWSQSRRQDAGVRLALGASPRRLVVTALVESTVLCSAGGIIGLLAYVWARPLFVSVLPPGLQAFAAETVDLRVIAATGGIALASAIAGGMLPAIRTSRLAPLDVLRPSPGVFGRVEGAPMLLGVQAAFGVVLLVGTLAILPGVVRTLLAPPGFDATDLFVINVPTSHDETAWDAREQTRRGLAALEVVRQSPAVVSAALSSVDPFWPSLQEEQGRNRSGFVGVVRPIDADFFRTLAVPITGRAFSHAEIDQQALVAIVNEAATRALWPGDPASAVIGRTLTTLDGPRVVIGVAADFRVGIEAPTEPTLFLPLSANEAYRPAGGPFPHNSYQIAIRMAPGRRPDGALLSERLRQQSWMGPWNGVTEYFLDSVRADVNRALETPRLLALIFATLAGITLVLTTIAMYGLASFEIRRRREEMTVRLALGATPRALRRRLALVIVTPVAIGVLVGLPFGWVQVKLVGLSLPFVNAADPQIYLASATAIVLAALVAAWLPGRRFFTMRVAELLRSS